MTSRTMRSMLALAVLLTACDGGAATPVDAGMDAMRPDAARVAPACAPGAPHDPYAALPAADLATVRGWGVRRGVVHVHTVYSHDACDERGFVDAEGNPDWVTGTRNEQCYRDLRAGICETFQDFVFLTDHRSYYPDFEYGDLLYFDEAQGDVLLFREGATVPYANAMRCPDGHTVVLQQGVDYDVLGLGIDHHVAETPEGRRMVYEWNDPSFDAMRASGGFVIAGYVPRIDDPASIHELSFDGIEIYNPVFNLQARLGEIASYVLMLDRSPQTLPVIELGLYLVFEETEATLRRWAAAVQHRRLPSVLGSNAHRNVFANPTPDGERLDSYRRLLHWFSNYVLVAEGEELTPDLWQERLAAGMAYGVFDFLGYAEGFDYHATVGTETFEMGSEIPAGAGTVLTATAPHVAGLPASAAPPVTVRIVRARADCPLEPPAEGDDHCWEEIATGNGTITVDAPTPGVYRAEARILPTHLRDCLGASPDEILREVLWVYGNAIYVGMDYGATDPP